MDDQWYHQSGGAARGPVTARELRRLAEFGGLEPDDPVWPSGKELADGVRAGALLPFPPRRPEPPAALPATAPRAAEWLGDLGAASAGGEQPKAAPPSVLSWLQDVRDSEESAQPLTDDPAEE